MYNQNLLNSNFVMKEIEKFLINKLTDLIFCLKREDDILVMSVSVKVILKSSSNANHRLMIYF